MARRDPLQRLPRTIGEIAVPQDDVSDATWRWAQRALPDYLLAHSVRSFCWGGAIAAIEGWTADPTILWTAALFHDIGLTRIPANTMCFEVEGGEIARRFLVRAGLSADEADRVAIAIVLHMRAGVTLDDGVEAVLLDRATSIDVRGDGFETIAAVRDGVVGAYPRGAFDRRFLAAIRREVAIRGTCQSARLLNDTDLAGWMAARRGSGCPERGRDEAPTAWPGFGFARFGRLLGQPHDMALGVCDQGEGGVRLGLKLGGDHAAAQGDGLRQRRIDVGDAHVAGHMTGCACRGTTDADDDPGLAGIGHPGPARGTGVEVPAEQVAVVALQAGRVLAEYSRWMTLGSVMVMSPAGSTEVVVVSSSPATRRRTVGPEIDTAQPKCVSFTTAPDRSKASQVPTCLPRSNVPARISNPSSRCHSQGPCISPSRWAPRYLIRPLS